MGMFGEKHPSKQQTNTNQINTMGTKTIKATTKTSPGKEIITGLTNAQAYSLVQALESANCSHVEQVYVTVDGYFFSPGNDLHDLVDLDPKVPAEAALLKVGKKQKKILLPGKYIARKRVLHEYTREEILDKKKEIEANTNAKW
jgi:hypothetical protein